MRLLPMILALCLGTAALADEIIKNDDGSFTRIKLIEEVIPSEVDVKKEIAELDGAIERHEALAQEAREKKAALMESFAEFIPEYKQEEVMEPEEVVVEPVESGVNWTSLDAIQ